MSIISSKINVKKAVRKYGEEFLIDPNWRYHYSLPESTIKILENGILCRRLQVDKGLHEQYRADYNVNGTEYISVALNEGYSTESYVHFIDKSCAFIIDKAVPIIRFKDEPLDKFDPKRILFHQLTKKVPVSTTYKDEAHVLHEIEPEYIVGMKLDNNTKINAYIFKLLIEANKNIKLYDFDSMKVLDCNTIIEKVYKKNR